MKERLADIMLLVYAGLIGMIGGIAHYMYKIHGGDKFKMKSFLINLFLSFFVGYIIGTFIPDSWNQIKYGLVGVSGFCTYPILNLLEKEGGKIFKEIVDTVIRRKSKE